MDIQRGMRDKLDKYIATASPVTVTLATRGGAVYDCCCFGVDAADKLSDENKITATPVTDGANIYVTYTTDLLADRFVKLHGASAFNSV